MEDVVEETLKENVIDPGMNIRGGGQFVLHKAIGVEGVYE